MARKRICLKICSALMVICFTLTTLASPKSAEAQVLTPQSAPLVFLIQEAHANYESQKNIAATLNQIYREHHRPESIIALEGTPFGTDVNPIVFRAFPVEHIRREVSESFLKVGKIDGAEFFAANDALDAQLTGIEDGTLYQQNLTAFRQYHPHQNECLSELQTIQSVVNKIKARIYSKSLLDFESSRKRLVNDGSTLYLHLILLEQLAKLKHIDMTRYPAISRLIGIIKRISTLTPKKANALISREDGGALFQEITQLESMLRAALPRSIDEKTLTVADRHLELLEKLASISLAKEEYAELMRIPNNWNALDNLLTRRGETCQTEALMRHMKPLLQPAFEFYTLAEKRDHALAANVLKLIHKQNRKIIFVITGGFHTSGIQETLTKNHVACTSLAPKPGLQTDSSDYFAQLDGRKTFEDILKSRTSTLRPERQDCSLEELLALSDKLASVSPAKNAAGIMQQFEKNLAAKLPVKSETLSIAEQIADTFSADGFGFTFNGKKIFVPAHSEKASAASLGSTQDPVPDPIKLQILILYSRAMSKVSGPAARMLDEIRHAIASGQPPAGNRYIKFIRFASDDSGEFRSFIEWWPKDPTANIKLETVSLNGAPRSVRLPTGEEYRIELFYRQNLSSGRLPVLPVSDPIPAKPGEKTSNIKPPSVTPANAPAAPVNAGDPVFEIDLDESAKPESPPISEKEYTDTIVKKLTETGIFRDVTFIAKGNMGLVFRATQITPQGPRVVAIKTLQANWLKDPDFILRFKLEGKVMAKVQAKHSLAQTHVVHLYDQSEIETPAGKAPYLVMEYLEEAKTLEDLMKESPEVEITNNLGLQEKVRRVPVSLAVKLIQRIALALDEFHKEKLVHRDIKPANIGLKLIHKEDLNRLKPLRIDVGSIHGNYIPILLDLGLVKRVRGSTDTDSMQSVTKTGEIMGTPVFMAPEQAIDSKKVDRRSDVYSLAASLFFMITGQHAIPYKDGEKFIDYALRITNDKGREAALQKSLSHIDRLGLSEKRGQELKAIFMKAIAASLEDRYQNAEAFAKDLKGFLKNQAREESEAPSDSDLTPIPQNSFSRYKKLLIVAAVSAALAVGAVVFNVFHTSTENHSSPVEQPKSHKQQSQGRSLGGQVQFPPAVKTEVLNSYKTWLAGLNHNHYILIESPLPTNGGAPPQMEFEWYPKQPTNPKALTALPLNNGAPAHIFIPSLQRYFRIRVYASPVTQGAMPVPQGIASSARVKPVSYNDVFANALAATGKYRDVSFLGKGGMAYVFKATSSKGKIVAVKTVQPQFLTDIDMVERFKAEISITGKVKKLSPFVQAHAIHMEDSGDVNIPTAPGDKAPYLVMDFVPESLDELAKEFPERDLTLADGRILKLRQVPVMLATRLIHRTALAFDEFHKAGMIHRDVKPDNIGLRAVTPEESRTLKLKPIPIDAGKIHGNYIPILRDLGLGKRLQDSMSAQSRISLTQEGETLGTIGFMSPEQANDSKSADKRADVYALAATLFKLITGQLPIPNKSKGMAGYFLRLADVKSRTADLEESLKLIDTLDLSEKRTEELKAIFTKAIAADLEDRYQTAGDFAKDLERFMKKLMKEEIQAASVSEVDSAASESRQSIELSAVRAQAAPAVAKRWLRMKAKVLLFGGIMAAVLTATVLLLKYQQRKEDDRKQQMNLETAAKERAKNIDLAKNRIQAADGSIGRLSLDEALASLTEASGLIQGLDSGLETEIQSRKNLIALIQEFSKEKAKKEKAAETVFENFNQRFEATAANPENPEFVRKTAVSFSAKTRGILIQNMVKSPHLAEEKVTLGIDWARQILNSPTFSSAFSPIERARLRGNLAHLLSRPSPRFNDDQSKQEYLTAASEFDQAYQSSTSNADDKSEALWAKANAEARAGRYDTANQTLDSFKEKFPNSELVPEVDFLKAENIILGADTQDGEYSRARELIKNYLNVEHPRHVQLRARLMTLYSYEIEYMCVANKSRDIAINQKPVEEYNRLREIINRLSTLYAATTFYEKNHEENGGNEVSYVFFDKEFREKGQDILKNSGNPNFSENTLKEIWYMLRLTFSSSFFIDPLIGGMPNLQSLTSQLDFINKNTEEYVKNGLLEIIQNPEGLQKERVEPFYSAMRILSGEIPYSSLASNRPKSDSDNGLLLMADGFHERRVTFAHATPFNNRAYPVRLKNETLQLKQMLLEAQKNLYSNPIEKYYVEMLIKEADQDLLLRESSNGRSLGQDNSALAERIIKETSQLKNFSPLVMEFNRDVLTQLLDAKRDPRNGNKSLAVVFLLHDRSLMWSLEHEYGKLLEDHRIYLVESKSSLAATSRTDLDNLTGRLMTLVGRKLFPEGEIQKLCSDQIVFLNDVFNKDWGKNILRVKYDRGCFKNENYRSAILTAALYGLHHRDEYQLLFQYCEEDNTYQLLPQILEALVASSHRARQFIISA